MECLHLLELPSSPRRLDFELPEALPAKIATVRCDDLNPNLRICEFVYDEYGKNLMKNAGHPDSVTQMVFQLAFALMEQETDGVNTYEALSMRHFKAWRTAQGHPLSQQSKEFVRAVKTRNLTSSSPSSSPVASRQGKDPAMEALIKGVETLSMDSRRTVLQGSDDRHLFALYCLMKMQGVKDPFLETCMTDLIHYKMSSSQVRQKFGSGGVFLPTEKDGYGLLYQIQDKDSVKVYVSSFVTEQGKTAEDFARYLRNAFDLVKPLLEAAANR